MQAIDAYYMLRPLIPRPVQVFLRRAAVRRKRGRVADIWPINPSSGIRPPGWNGWPEGKKFALVLTHDVEGPAGQVKCLDLMQMETKMGFRSSFNFVPEGYEVSPAIRETLGINGFEVGVHGLTHDGKLYSSRKSFEAKAKKINEYLEQWGASGFRSPAMHHNLEWIHEINIEYDASTFDTDPFEPQPDGHETIFPFLVGGDGGKRGYVELPYTLPQDFTLFVLLREKGIDTWKRKLDWIAKSGGMALLITHPDYMKFGDGALGNEEYPVAYYWRFLSYLQTRYRGEYWAALPREMARFWRENVARETPGAASGTGIGKSAGGMG
jgi:hypothetical protein